MKNEYFIKDTWSYRTYFFLCAFLPFFIMNAPSAYSQEDQWNLLQEDNSLAVYYQPFTCHVVDADPLSPPTEIKDHQEHLKLKFVNKSTSALKVQWFKDISPNGDSELESMSLPVGETIISEVKRTPKLRLGLEGSYVSLSDFIEAFSIAIN